jgi:hypothetical protein
VEFLPTDIENDSRQVTAVQTFEPRAQASVSWMPQSASKVEDIVAALDMEDKAVAPGDLKYDFFMSHKQSNGQDAVMTLRIYLSERCPGATFWLDTEQNPTAEGMRDGVKHCANFVLFCTEGATDSHWIQMEIRWALQYCKNIIIVTETDERHGRPDMETLIGNAPEDLKQVFSHNVAIPWYRDPEFRNSASKKSFVNATIPMYRMVVLPTADMHPYKLPNLGRTECYSHVCF